MSSFGAKPKTRQVLIDNPYKISLGNECYIFTDYSHLMLFTCDNYYNFFSLDELKHEKISLPDIPS